MKVVVGLGNPGLQYDRTRHNVGFTTVMALAQRWGGSFSKRKFEALLSEVVVGQEKVILVLPQTYMNLSGQSVAPLLHFFQLPLESLVVVHDELDLPLGRLKVVRQGRSAGQRGVQSIQDHLQSQNLYRFRLGIGRPTVPQAVSDFVLERFKPQELVLVESMIEKAQLGLEIFVKEGIEAAIQFCHQPEK